MAERCTCTRTVPADELTTERDPRCPTHGDPLPTNIRPGLLGFVRESNRIEGIDREPHSWEVTAHDEFLKLRTVTVDDMKQLVSLLQPGARIRTEAGMNVIVGGHRPPPGGPKIREELMWLLSRMGNPDTPLDTHIQYETLHPFMDGNGRSGRALWAWQMMENGRDPFLRPFLHTWYYQSLQASR